MTRRHAAFALAAVAALFGPRQAVLAQSEAPADVAPPAWVARGSADLVVLDKVSARTSPLAAAIGKPMTYGSLTIVVGACDVRPPNQPADATAWLDVTDRNPGGPAFHGWILKAEPAASGLEHPLYDLRLAGCR